MIRVAESEDAVHLPAVEDSASLAFLSIPELAWLVDAPPTSVEQHLQRIEMGTTWVATSDAGHIAGFLSAERFGTALHIWEVSVAQEHQRQGIGGRLIAAAVAWGRENQLASVELTTFVDVAWNAPYYEKLGFRRLAAEAGDRLQEILRLEEGAGLPVEQRCAMRLTLA